MMKRILIALALIVSCVGSARSQNPQYHAPYASAIDRTYPSKMADIVSVFDFIPVSLQSAIKAGTSTTDVSSYLTAMHAAVPAGVEFFFPAGQYNIGAGSVALTGRTITTVGVTFTGGGSITGALYAPTNVANPTSSVGLSANNGSAATAMRSDGAPALSATVQSALTGTNAYLLAGTGAVGFSSQQYATLAQGGLGGSQAAATAGQMPVYPGSGGAAVPSGFLSAGTGAVPLTFQQKAQQILNGADFGMTCNGVTNDDSAFSAAFTRATAASTLLILPGPNCIVSGNFTLPDNIYITGQGQETTSIYITSTTNTLFTISAGRTATISNLRILPATTRTASAVYIQSDSVNPVTLTNVHFYSGGIGVKTTAEGFLNLRNVNFTNTVLNGVELDIGGCFLCNIENVIILDDPANRPFANVIFRSVSGQIQFINSTFTHGQTGWYVLPGNGQVVTLIKSELTYIDSVGGSGIIFAPTGTGLIQRFTYNNGWIAQGGSAGVTATGNGSNIDQISFDNVDFLNNVTDGITASGVTRLDILNSRFQATTNAIVLDGVVGCHIAGNYLGIASVTTALTMLNATDKCKIENNDFGVAATPVTNSSSGTANYFGPNVGYNPVSFPTGITTGDLLQGSAANGILSRLVSGTGVLTALGVNVGTAGAFVINGGALGTPSSGVATNLTGTASGLTVGEATTTNRINSVDQTTAYTTYTPTITCATGTVTSATATGRYKTLGKTIFFHITLTITTTGTCSYPKVTTPTTSSAVVWEFSGKDATGGVLITGELVSSANVITLAKYDGTNPAVDGHTYYINGSYESN